MLRLAPLVEGSGLSRPLLAMKTTWWRFAVLSAVAGRAQLSSRHEYKHAPVVRQAVQTAPAGAWECERADNTELRVCSSPVCHLRAHVGAFVRFDCFV